MEASFETRRTTRRRLPQFLPDPPQKQLNRDLWRKLAIVRERQGGRPLLNQIIEQTMSEWAKTREVDNG